MNKNRLLTSKDEAVPTVKVSSILLSKLITNALNLSILALAVTALAFSPILTKLSELELSPVATIFNRLWIATVVVSFWQLIKTLAGDRPLEQIESTRNYWQQGLLLLASFCATASAILWAISLTQTSVASSTVLRSLTPLFISLEAWLILKQHFSYQFIIGMMLSIAGAIGIGWDDLQLSRDYLIGDGIALVSAALHGVNIVIIGYLRDRDCPTEKVLLWRCAGGAFMILPVVYLTDFSIPSSLQGWLTIIALAVVCQTLGQGLLVHSLQQFSASFVGVFALLKPAITALLAWIIFAEDISLTNGVALVLILIGIYLAQLNDSSLKNSVRQR